MDSALSPAIHETGGRIELPQGATPEGGSRRRRGFRSTRSTNGRLRFQPSRAAPSLPYQAPNKHAENAGVGNRRHPEEPLALDRHRPPLHGRGRWRNNRAPRIRISPTRRRERKMRSFKERGLSAKIPLNPRRHLQHFLRPTPISRQLGHTPSYVPRR
jgi:hypothetical protein